MATSRREIAGIIEKFIRRQFQIIEEDPHFSRDAHLFEGGYVDSAGVVELLMFVESTFRVKLDDAQIFSDMFTTINGISAMLAPLEANHDGWSAALSRE